MNIQGIGQTFGMIASSAISGSRRAGPGFDPPQPPDAETIMEQDDTDQDGQLSIDETPLTEEMFSDADTDGDGYLSSAELDEFITSRPPPMGGPEGMGPPPEPMDASSIMENESNQTLRFDLAMDAYQKSVTGYMGSLGQTGESGMFQNLLTDLIA